MEITANCMKIRNTGCSLQHRHGFGREFSLFIEVKQLDGSCVSEGEDSLELDGQRDGVEEDVDLEDAEEEEAEVFEHLGEEIPEEADVWGQVWY